MSVQYGNWSFDGQPLSADYLAKVSALLAPYGPDNNQIYCEGGVSIVYRAFHTTKESFRETQPNISASGAVITWDGRLDNRTELISELRAGPSTACSDVEIVSAAYEKWGASCLAKLIGDWALSIWNPIPRTLLIATDPIGTRHLYYSFDNHRVTWCTILDPLVLLATGSFEICEEYIAGYFVHLTAPNITPYVGVHAVSPSSAVLISPRKREITQYWDFDPSKRIRYTHDADYDEHFRTVFATAVRRRLRSDRPVLAELSGGMDSASIVCMADVITACHEAETANVDTVSFYDDYDPGLDERVYLNKVEEKRGRTGFHIDLSAQRKLDKREVDSRKPFLPTFESARFAATPNPNQDSWPEVFEPYARYMKLMGYRVTLSGVGGEDSTGGYVPTPIPELQDLISRAQLREFPRQAGAWGRKMAKHPLLLLWEVLRSFWGDSVTNPWAPRVLCPPPWFRPGFVKRNRAALLWYPSRLKLSGALPSFQNQIQLLNHIRRFLAYRSIWPEMLREIRYPYLDRDLLEFACAIPRQQMVGVGKRRFLMKRALAGIVPDEILNRKRKASVAMKSETDITQEWPSSAELGDCLITGLIDVVNRDLLSQALQRARTQKELSVESLKRTLILEFWLRHLATKGLLKAREPIRPLFFSSKYSEHPSTRHSVS